MACDTAPLEQLLSPIGLARFMERHWTSAPLSLAGGAEDRFGTLFSRAAIDPLLSSYGRLVPAEVRVAKYSSGSYETLELEPGRPLNVDQLLDAFAQGYTLNVNSLEERVPALGELCGVMSDYFGASVTANLYVTPAGAQAFPLHFDTHEVFALQIEGEKRWRVFEPLTPYPIETAALEHTVAPEAVGELRLDSTLGAGDLLYVPRGFVHQVSTAEALSVHISIGVFMPTWLDVLHRCIDAAAAEESSLRRVLPHAAQRTRETLRAKLSQLLSGSVVADRVDHYLSEQAADVLGRRPSVAGARFSRLAELGNIGLDSALHRRPNATCRVIRIGDRVAIQFPGNRLQGPRAIEPALHFIARSEGAFIVRELPGLDEPGRVVLARRLLRAGLLEPL